MLQLAAGASGFLPVLPNDADQLCSQTFPQHTCCYGCFTVNALCWFCMGTLGDNPFKNIFSMGGWDQSPASLGFLSWLPSKQAHNQHQQIIIFTLWLSLCCCSLHQHLLRKPCPQSLFAKLAYAMSSELYRRALLLRASESMANQLLQTFQPPSKCSYLRAALKRGS